MYIFFLLYVSSTFIIRFFFFFQAEDGIRDFHVTGVQTCALPISKWPATWLICKVSVPLGARPGATVAWERSTEPGASCTSKRPSLLLRSNGAPLVGLPAREAVERTWVLGVR